MVEKKPKRIISAGGSHNKVLSRPRPRSRLNPYLLKTTLGTPGVHTCLRLEIRSQ